MTRCNSTLHLYEEETQCEHDEGHAGRHESSEWGSITSWTDGAAKS